MGATVRSQYHFGHVPFGDFGFGLVLVDEDDLLVIDEEVESYMVSYAMMSR